MNVIFRRATNRDRALAQHIVGDALRAYGLHLLLESSDVDLSDIDAQYDSRGGQLEIIESADGTPLGVLGWRPATGDVFELKKLYLTPNARGLGLGRRCVERVVDAAHSAGARAIVLETSNLLTEANRLYTRLGFKPVSGQAAASFATLSQECDIAYRLELGDTRREP